MPVNVMHSIVLKKESAHEDPIYCCAWTSTNVAGDSKSPKKDVVVTGGLDGLVKVWQLNNNKLELLHTLKGHDMAVVSVAVSPDGYNIASTSLDSRLYIWDVISGAKVQEIQTKATDVWKVIFSPDGTQVAVGGHTGKIMIYGIEKGQVDKILDTRGKFTVAVTWSPNGKYIASGAVDGAVCIFDFSQGKLIHTIEAHTQTVRSIAFSPDSQLLVTASNDNNAKIYNVVSASVQSKLEHKCWVLNARFSPDGSRVATAVADGSVRVALADSLSLLHTFQDHTDMVWDVYFDSKSTKLLSVSKDKSINIYECPVPPKTVAKPTVTLVK